jgi:hypothetical protein
MPIFEGREDFIAEKKVFFGNLGIDITFDWNDLIKLMDSHPDHLVSKNADKFRINLNSFHQRESAPQFAKDIEAEMQDVFALHGNRITNIAFCGFWKNNTSYPWHKDEMDVLLVQVLSTVDLRVEGVNNNEPRPFRPGEYVWLPRGTHHEILPSGSRLSFSFGVEGDPDPSIYF